MRKEWLTRYLIVLAAIILLFACAMQVWVASRLPLWGDELDHIATVFRHWTGDHNFWWHMGQFNANPPGDDLALRAYYGSGFLRWLDTFSPELYWRLPYVLLYCATAALAFFGAWRWTESVFIGFLVFIYSLTAHEMLIYATEARFYMSLVFFMTIAVWQFMVVVERPYSREFFAMALLVTLGVWHHLMLAAVGYLVFAYAGYWCLVRVWTILSGGQGDRSVSLKQWASILLFLLGGALPFILYKVELKHFLFIPSPWKELSPWKKLFESNLTQTILGPIAYNQPLPTYGGYWLYFLGAAMLAAIALSFRKKRLERVVQGVFLLAMVFGTPIALFLSSAARNYGLLGRHFIYEVPLVTCSLVYLWMVFGELLQPQLRILAATSLRAQRIGVLALGVVATTLSVNAVSELSSSAYFLRDKSPAKVTYPLVEWRAFYRHIPGPRALVIVGSQPDLLNALTDVGGFKAGEMNIYTKEFSPLFYSVKGGYDSEGKEDPSILRRIDSHPEKYDFLIFDDAQRVQGLLPKLPWTRWQCAKYENGQPLSFCRL